MKNYILTILGLAVSTIGTMSNLVLESITFGLTLQILGFLLCLINLIFILKGMHKKRNIYKRKLRKCY